MKNINKLLLTLLTLILTTQTVFAQSNDAVQGLVDDSKNDLLIVVGGGLAGAVLGLSTLSFVEEPKEHTRNILVGASIGVIAGVAIVAYTQANKSREAIYGTGKEEAFLRRDTKNFDTSRRVSWHSSETQQKLNPIVSPYQLNFSFNY